MQGRNTKNPDQRMAGFRQDLKDLGYAKTTIVAYCIGIRRYLAAGHKLEADEADQLFHKKTGELRKINSQHRKGVRLFIQYINGVPLESLVTRHMNAELKKRKRCTSFDCFNCPYDDCIEP